MDPAQQAKKFKLPTISSAMTQPILGEALRCGFGAEPFLAPSEMSLVDVQRGEARLPGQHCYDLLDGVAKAVGNPHLGCEIGRYAALENLSNLNALETEQATLGELLMTLIVDAARHSTISTYRIETDGHAVRVLSTRTFAATSPPGQSDGYYYGFMSRLTAACCGPEWQPKLFKGDCCIVCGP